MKCGNEPKSKKTEAKVGLGFGAKLKAYLLTGVLVTAPVSITLYLAWIIVTAIDGVVSPLIPEAYNPETYLPFSLPGLGLVVVLVGLTLIGFLTAGFFGRAVIGIGEWILARMPVVRSVYSSLKQIFETVLKNQSNAFRQVVLVEYPRRGIWAVGFLTGRTMGEIQSVTEDDLVSVFVPTTPNLTSGFLLFFPRKEIHVLDMSVEEGIKMVVSSGIVTPPDNRTGPKENVFTSRSASDEMIIGRDKPSSPQ